LIPAGTGLVDEAELELQMSGYELLREDNN